MKISATHKTTGELVEFDVTNLTELVSAWRTVQEYEKLATNLKDQLKKLLRQYINEDGKSDEVDGYRFTSSFVTRKQYDKSALRRLIDDEDFFDELMVPDKALIDKLLKGDQKKNIDPDPRLWSISSELRDSMIDGTSYTVTKLEKLS